MVPASELALTRGNWSEARKLRALEQENSELKIDGRGALAGQPASERAELEKMVSLADRLDSQKTAYGVDKGGR